MDETEQKKIRKILRRRALCVSDASATTAGSRQTVDIIFLFCDASFLFCFYSVGGGSFTTLNFPTREKKETRCARMAVKQKKEKIIQIRLFFFVKKKHLFIYIEIDWRRMSPPHALKSRQFAAKEK